MKKIISLALAALLLASLCVSAAAENDVYSLLSDLLNGREITLTVTAENVEGDDLAEFLAPYGSFTCKVAQENDTITLDVTTEGDAYLKATATAETVTLSTNLIEMEDVTTTWEVLASNVTLVKDEKGASLKIGMTGPNMELMNFSVKLTGTELGACTADVSIGFITGPGAIYAVYDTVTGENGEAERDFYFTWDEYEVHVEGTGTEEIDETAITRTEDCTVSLDEDEIGTLTIRSVLEIH